MWDGISENEEVESFDENYEDLCNDPFIVNSYNKNSSTTESLEHALNFDYNELNDYIYSIIRKMYGDYNIDMMDKSFAEIFVMNFVKTLKFIISHDVRKKFNNEYSRYNLMSIIFINFTEYFNIDYTRGFNVLPQKIKAIIEKELVRNITKQKYDKYKEKYANTNDIHTHLDVTYKKLV